MAITSARLTRLVPIFAAVIGTLAAVFVAVLPEWRLVILVEALRLPSVLSAAAPPLGATARTLLAVVAGGLVGGAAYGALRLALRLVPGPREAGVPVLRRADAHPDHPARRPIRAMEDLGTPLPDGEPRPRRPILVGREHGQPMPMRAAADAPIPAPIVERTLPADLDTPLAVLDPAAIPAAPREPVRPVAPLARPAPVVEEAFDLIPIRRAVRAKVEREPRPATVTGLLDRLEREAALGVRPKPSADGLGTLRGLAVR